MTMITPSYLGETIEYSSLHACRSTLEDPTPKFEEDDGDIVVSADGKQTGNHTNADLPYYPAVWQTHLVASVAAYRNDASGKRIGYTVKVAWEIGDRPLATDPYLDAGTYDKYYGGLKTMMPWAAKAPKKTPAKEHSQP